MSETVCMFVFLVSAGLNLDLKNKENESMNIGNLLYTVGISEGRW